MEWLVDQLRDVEEFRKDLPRLRARNEILDHGRKLRDALTKLWDETLIERFLNEQDQLAQPRPNLGLPWTARPSLAGEDRLNLRCVTSRGAPVQEIPGERSVALAAAGKKFKFPAAAAGLLKAMLSGKPFTIESMCAAFHPAFAKEAIRALAQQLVDEGIVAIDS